MAADSIEATGARPGDKVLCVGTSEPWRYTVGKVYSVFGCRGKPGVYGETSKAERPILRRGYGATWEMVPKA